jgi:hypothetical protein
MAGAAIGALGRTGTLDDLAAAAWSVGSCPRRWTVRASPAAGARAASRTARIGASVPARAGPDVLRCTGIAAAAEPFGNGAPSPSRGGAGRAAAPALRPGGVAGVASGRGTGT